MDNDHDFDPLIYAQLRRIARLHLRAERRDHLLQATELVHEACIRLMEDTHADFDRGRIIRTGAKIMRQILIDYARNRNSLKRGGNQIMVSLGDASPEMAPWRTLSLEQVITLDKAMAKLHEIDPRQALIVELRFFGGLTEKEIAKTLDVSERTVKRDWDMARAWLRDKLGMGGNKARAATT